MKRITIAFWSVFAAMSLAWLVVEPSVVTTATFIPMRNLMVQHSGLLAMAAMSVAMVLAVRPARLERHLGGLDKMYRLHKWLGIAALALSVSHWLWANGPKWAVAWGLMERGQRGPRSTPSNPIEQMLASYRGTAEVVGEWTFYGVVLLSTIALVKLVPYRWFYKTHRLLALAYLALVLHVVVLTKPGYWLSPVGVLLIGSLLAGSYCAVLALVRRIGAGRKVRGEISAIQYYPGVHALEVTVGGVDGWQGHKPGQFAFVTSQRTEGAHPYTIASSWVAERNCITFIVKELGDHTARLRESLHKGQEVVIEGPYGCFTFEDDRPVQIWVGGGIGITPFIARMRFLAGLDAQTRSTTVIHLFHPTATTDAEALGKLEADAQAAGVHLHVSVDTRDGLLTGARIRAVEPGWSDASVWCCGPSGLSRALRADFSRAGMAVERAFHQELFEMR